MHRSVKTVLIRVMIQALILSDLVTKPVLGISCSYTNSEGSCFLVNVSMFTDFEAKEFIFPSEKNIILYAPTIVSTGNKLLNHLPNVVKELEIQEGSVPELFIQSTLIKISAFGNLVRDVTIGGPGPYSLKELTIVYNQLRSVPRSIKMLTNLQKLVLHDNQIETVNMNHFENLIHLETLKLYRNKITRIATSVTLRLPHLILVDLESNYLEHFSVKLWNFPNLKNIDLNNNKLRKIDNFWGHFPNLTYTDFAQNEWSCAWLEETLLPILEARKMTVYTGYHTCPGKSVKALCCYDSVEDVKNSLEKSMTEHRIEFEQIGAKMETAVQQINGLISKLDNKLDRTNEELKIIKARVNENRALIGDVLRKNSREVDNIQTAVDRNVKLLKEEVKTVESTFSNKVSENRADTHKLEKKIGEMKIDMDRNVQTIKEESKTTESIARKQVEIGFREVNARINQSWALLEDDRKKFEAIDREQKQLEQIVVSLQSDMRRTVQTNKEEVDAIKSSAKKQLYEHTQLEEKVTILKSGIDEKLSNSNIQTRNEFEWVKEKLDENRALINDVVEDLYLEELEKEEL